MCLGRDDVFRRLPKAQTPAAASYPRTRCARLQVEVSSESSKSDKSATSSCVESIILRPASARYRSGIASSTPLLAGLARCRPCLASRHVQRRDAVVAVSGGRQTRIQAPAMWSRRKYRWLQPYVAYAGVSLAAPFIAMTGSARAGAMRTLRSSRRERTELREADVFGQQHRMQMERRRR
jgi:hypothetical protein